MARTDVYPGRLTLQLDPAPWNAPGYLVASPNGRYVALAAAGDSEVDIGRDFTVIDTASGTSVPLSPDVRGVMGVSDDGSRVLALAPKDSAGVDGLVLYNLAAGTASRLPNAIRSAARLSADGQVAAYYCGTWDGAHICAWNANTGQVHQGPSTDDSFGNAAGPLVKPLAITGDGGQVVVQVECPGVTAGGDGPYLTCPILWSPATGAIESIAAAWPSGTQQGTFFELDISQDGQYVAMFASAGDSNSASGLWLLDRTSGQRHQVTTARGGGTSSSVSDNGEVLYGSRRTDLSASPVASLGDVFLWTKSTGNVRLSQTSREAGNDNGTSPAGGISADGKSAYFVSMANMTRDARGTEPKAYRWTR